MLGTVVRIIISVIFALVIAIYVANIANAAFFYESRLVADGVLVYKSEVGSSQSVVKTYFETEGNTEYYVKYMLVPDEKLLNWWWMF